MDFSPSPVICFQHCQRDVDILCFQMPDKCPLCDEDMETTSVLEMPPFNIPCPFVTGASSPYCLLIQPTQGNFLLDYKNSVDLHVGITDSRGTVYDYDSEGLHTSTVRWQHCLAIKLEKNNLFQWDTKMQEFAMKPEWQASRYDEEKHNCYHFVIEFLQYYGVQKYPSDSSEFCETIIIPKTTQAAKYIGLYRKLKSDTIIINYRNTANAASQQVEDDGVYEEPGAENTPRPPPLTKYEDMATRF